MMQSDSRSRSIELLLQASARQVAATEGIPLGVALARVRVNGKITMAEMTRRRASMVSPFTVSTVPSTVPPIPSEGITDARTANAYLSKTHPLWSKMGMDDRFQAAIALRDLCTKQRSILLSQDRRPIVLACLFPGITPTQRARSFLLATEAGFDRLPLAQQISRAIALDTTHNVIDFEAT